MPGGGASRETQGARPHFPTSHAAGRLFFPSGWAYLGFPCRNQRPPHSDPGTLPGGLLGGRCGCRTWERSLRTPTCRRGHRQYLRSGPPYDFPRYRSKVHEVTQAFAAVSREVMAVEAELAGPRAQPLLAGHVRSLQQLEQTRLATVALLQLMGAPELTGQENTLQTHQLKMKVIKTMEAISEVLQDLRFDAEFVE